MGLFLDTNVLIKLYVDEEWSDWAESLVFDSRLAGRLFISDLVLIEANAALAAMVRRGEIDHREMLGILEQVYEDTRRSFHFQTYQDSMLSGTVARIGLRPHFATGALDMVHLETVAHLNRMLTNFPTISIASADVRLLKAAHRFGVEFQCPLELLPKVLR